MNNILKKVLLFVFALFVNITFVGAKETIRTCKYELNNLGSFNTVYVELVFTKNCKNCSVHGNVDLEKSYYFDSKDSKSYKFSTLSDTRTLIIKANSDYNNEEKNNCPEAMFVGVRDGHWVNVYYGTKKEMQTLSDNNSPEGGFDYSYRDRYVITESGVLTDQDIINIDNRLINRNNTISEKYREYEGNLCPPFTGNINDGDYLKKWQNNLKIKGKTTEEIQNILEECKKLKTNLNALITSAEDDLGDVENKGYSSDRDAAKNLKKTINKIKEIDSSISEEENNNIQPGELQKGCEVIPPVIRKWINNILNFVRYVALALVIALGALDFMKAAGSGEGDAMKKAGQSFMKRMIAVVILFLLPVIVDFILNMINIYGVDTNNVDCL